jgi:arsenate reductase
LALLEIRNLDFEVYLYLDHGVSVGDLDLLMSLDGIIRTGDETFRNSGIDSGDSAGLRTLLLKNPSLLQRPILIANGRAAIGRPPENILTLLHDA